MLFRSRPAALTALVRSPNHSSSALRCNSQLVVACPISSIAGPWPRTGDISLSRQKGLCVTIRARRELRSTCRLSRLEVLGARKRNVSGINITGPQASIGFANAYEENRRKRITAFLNGLIWWEYFRNNFHQKCWKDINSQRMQSGLKRGGQ